VGSKSSGVNNTVSGGIQKGDGIDERDLETGLMEERKNHEQTEIELSKQFPGLSMANNNNAEEIELNMDDFGGAASPLK